MTTAQYLLRFDDLCPTMDRERWQRFVPLMARFGVCPILAVVPDNQDPQLRVAPVHPGFWSAMRTMQAAGASIALHGYQHLCVTTGRSLVPLHRQTEFAGAPKEAQRAWVQAGLRLLRAEGLAPCVWVAPRHGLDRHTVEVLRAEGIVVISDGLARRPYRAYGTTWIPQQLWRPVEKLSGLWTICIHANTASDEGVVALERFLEQHAGAFTSVDRVLAEWPIRNRTVIDRVHQTQALLRLRLRRIRRS